MLGSTTKKWSRCSRSARWTPLRHHLPNGSRPGPAPASPLRTIMCLRKLHRRHWFPRSKTSPCVRTRNRSCGRYRRGHRMPSTWLYGSVQSIATKKRHSGGLVGFSSVGDKEGISSDGWTIVRIKQKNKLLDCPQSTVSRVFKGSFRAAVCKSGTTWFANPNGFRRLSFYRSCSFSAGNNVHPTLDGPEVRSLERLFRVNSVVEDQGLPVDANKAGGRVPLLRVNSEWKRELA